MITIYRLAIDGTEALVGGIGLVCRPADAHRHLSGLGDGGYRVEREGYADAYFLAQSGTLRPCKRDVLLPNEVLDPPGPIFPVTV